ncbi:glycosyltransferase [Acinetobacter sp. ANC 3832]|uniref:glycosyltransferase n=1 Tax=Acinetobacter sp. ANC 3832 TaxID=1977874 RepID=UPI000A33A604|nr:glycosyltransferase [Acinetobacter sp. ANC 3832]OTG90615.1 glycosyl transferase [Acinetobacter sp. ANC 3832]
MNIIYLITGLGGGGAEKVVVDLADKMSEYGHQVKIAYLKGNVVIRPENVEIELIYLGLESIKNSKKSYQRYKKLLLDFKPDVVHAHMVHANIFARISRFFSPIPKLVCTAHSNIEGGKARMLAYRVTHHLSDLTTNVSQSASENFVRLGAVPTNGITTVYNGIKLDRFHRLNTNESLREEIGLSTTDIMLLAVGRLHEAKDYPNLFNAIEILFKEHSESKYIHLFVVGDGNLKSEFEKLITDKKLKERIHLLGRRNDIPELMSAADVFILSSSFEGFGLVVAEAMACETYVVATDCGGVKEVMGGFGTLVPKSDPQLLADGIHQALLLSSGEKGDNNANALQYVKNTFALDRIVGRWIEIYES